MRHGVVMSHTFRLEALQRLLVRLRSRDLISWMHHKSQVAMRWLGLLPQPLVHPSPLQENNQSLRKCHAFKPRREALRLPSVRPSIAGTCNMKLGATLLHMFRLEALQRLLVRLLTRYLIS